MIGIYQIENKENGMIYIGSSNNIFNRWKIHIANLNNKTHHSYKLQEDWNQQGLTGFSFSILELVNNKNKLKEAEQIHIDSYDQTILYNVLLYTNYKSISVSQDFIDTLSYMNSLDYETIELLKNNIIIYEKIGKLAKFSESEWDLSKKWFLNNQTGKVKTLKNNIYNYNKNHIKAKSNEIAWTTFTSSAHLLMHKGSKKGFIPLNGELNKNITKRNVLVFAANCYPNSFIKNIYEEPINDEQYALSLMINWIINASNINKPIKIYIPSDRMEKILINWINE
jgi:group I intron endonuclease